MAAVICLSMVFPAFAFYDVTLQEDGGVTGTATVEMSVILSQSTISLKRTYEVGGQTETSEAVSETIYTADPSAFTFSESVHGSEGGIGDYENATTLYDIVSLKKDGDSRKGVWIYGDDAESPFPDYREILKAENMEKYDMFRLSSAAGQFFIVFGEAPLFSDVQPGAYYYDAVEWAVEKDITTGTGENAFSPDMTCTTSQILTFLWRANGSPEPSVANPFTNVSDDAYYAKAAVWAHESGPVSGTVFDGSYTVYPSFPEAGSTVTVTPKPDACYTVDTVTVTDSKGNTVAVTKGENGKYTYVQPSCAVTVAVTFKPVSGAFDCPRDESCPMAVSDDLSLGAWYHDGVHYCIDEDIMKGVDDGVFAPDVSTSRAMIAVMLWRLDGSPDMDGQNLGYPYADVNPDSWYTDAVYWARLNGVVTGYDTEHFGTDDAVTREQLAAMLFRYAKYKGIDMSKYESTDLSSFADAAYISDYALSAVKWACGAGIIKGAGDESSLSPKGETSRAEIAVMFMRYCVNISK